MNNEAFDFPSHEEFIELVPVYAGFKAGIFTTGQFSIQELADESSPKSTVHISCSSELQGRAAGNVHIAINSMI